jgi:hypothetical protein
MLQRNAWASFLVILALGSGPVLAQQPQRDMHHPNTTPPAATAAPAPAMPGGSMSGAGGMPMMGMMRMMGPDGMGMSMMPAMAGHVEGRLAYLKTELKVTDAQLPLWNAVADAIRADAKAMGDMPGGMMGSMQAATLPGKVAAR